MENGISNNMQVEQKRFLLLACHVVWRELCQTAAVSPHELFPVFLKQGLHNEPDNLRARVQEQIDLADQIAEKTIEELGQEQPYDAILLGYGLCSNGIAGLRSKYYKLVVPRGHDCITLLLGSKEAYRSYFDNNPGVYWYNGGWIATGTMPGPERIALLRKIFMERYEDEDTVEFLLEEEFRWMKNYSETCFVRQDDLLVSDQAKEQWQSFCRSCASWCGWKYNEIEGDLGLLQKLVNGDWPADAFLVLEPGQVLQPSFDEDIVKGE